MRSDSLLKHLAISAIITAVFYVTAFSWIEHRRTTKGTWEVTFRADADGKPSLLIAETNLNISKTIIFPGQTFHPANFSRTIEFGPKPPDLPFGDLIFQDPTFLPGTVTLSLFKHQVELLPRVLNVDNKEYPWQSGAVVEVK